VYEFILQTRAKTIGSDEINLLWEKKRREQNRKKEKKRKIMIRISLI